MPWISWFERWERTSRFTANEVTNLGIAVVRFDFTPLGNITRQVEEVSAVVNYCRQVLERRRIYLLGRSMGGSAALVYAAQYGHIAGICLWATPWDLRETFRLVLHEDYEKLVMGQTIGIDTGNKTIILQPDFIQDFANYQLLSSIKQLNVPVFILHGDQDEIVPVQQAQLLYQSAKQPKKIHVIHGGDHQLHKFYAESTKVILSWLHSVC
ncbi:hypothetical protein P22_2261 [Propionispora sp. 2/2-37]|uniref:alpha/beta hydrolase n=1 Tax=Propionispora sp. 2/2-37 TaxID=1677858 RepID=UPI0006C42C36|nr:YqiA/YcfP family alpha/beta fold hydrolase [Propionispora sp. 2/2-37]CUH96173.1 hypothetical protein P22_2261 [Propionispora sp. 2/2-37]